ncbi:MAG: hypothetical protein CFE44_19495, partial [Burkholderiales bacterium PBB4]
MPACLLWLGLLWTWRATAAEPTITHERITVIYARELAEKDARLEYPVRLLELALTKSGVNFELRSDARPMPQSAAIKRLASGINVNVVWSMTTREREEQLLPIRIPIDKGLFGYRIAFVSRHNRHALAQVKTLQDLRALTAGQGHDWPDTEILRANGLKVNTTSAHQNLFPMMTAGRFDYFPRSVLEIGDESGMLGAKDAVVDPYVLLHYPVAVYFFVNRADKPLAQILERGLTRALADGSFAALYYQRFGAVLKRAKLHERVAIELNNPLLTPET